MNFYHILIQNAGIINHSIRLRIFHNKLEQVEETYFLIRS